MKDLKQIVRKLKSRLTLEELYIYVVLEIYYKVFINYVYFYHVFNTINLKKVVEYVYNNYFVDWDNIKDVSLNIIELLVDKHLFIFSDENEPFRIREYIILNNYYTKQSKEFKSFIKKKPKFKNLINDFVQNRLKDYVIDINFIHSILHSDSILYKFIETDCYDGVLDKLVEYMVTHRIATRIESITKGITTSVGIFNFPMYEEIYFLESKHWDTRFHETDIQIVYDAFKYDVDILYAFFGKNQLSSSYTEDFDLVDYIMYHR